MIMSKRISQTILDLKDPTNSKNYVDRGLVKGSPLVWQDDATGTVPAAVMSFLEHSASEEQLSLVIAYIQYHIHAPCWLENFPWSNGVDEEMTTEIKALRELSLKLKIQQDVHAYISRA